MSDGPHPEDPVYQMAARTLLQKMREVCDTERKRCGEVPESWPSEVRIFPASVDTAEGVLYMPRAVPPVYTFQCSAHQDNWGEIHAHIHGLAPLTPDILELALDYQKRASHYVFTCTCGHVIPKVLSFPLDLMDQALGEAQGQTPLDEDGAEILTSDDIRIQEIVSPQERNYSCPACGFKPNRRY